MKDLILSGIAGLTSVLSHGAAHYTFGNPESFAAAGVSEVGAVVLVTSTTGSYLLLNLDQLKGMY